MFYLSGVDATLHFLTQIALWGLAAYWLSRWTSRLSAAALFVLGTGALFFYTAPMSPYYGQPAAWTMSLSTGAASTFAEVLMGVLIVCALRTPTWITVFQVLGVFNAVLMLIQRAFFHDFFQVGVLFDPSMSGCLSACLIPLYFSRRSISIWGAGLIAVSILGSGASMPIALLFLIIGIVLIHEGLWVFCLSAVGTSVLLGWLCSAHPLLSTTGRLPIWGLTLQYWKEHANVWVGFGLGSFYYIGEKITQDFTGNAWLWMHSDWLQLLFETGIIGLCSALAIYFDALWKSRRHLGLFSSLAAYGVFMATNFPTHLPVSGIFGLVLLRWAFEKEHTKTQNLSQTIQESSQARQRQPAQSAPA